MTPTKEAGNVLKLRRILAGFKQYELAVELGVNESVISKIEVGRRKVSIEEAKILAKALKCTPEKLFDINDLELTKEGLENIR